MTKKIKVIFFLKYWLAAFIIIMGLNLIHYPEVFFHGTTIEYVTHFLRDGLFSAFAYWFVSILFYSIIFIPFLIFAKVNYVGWIPIAIFSIFTGLEKYIFYVQGNDTPWNIGFNSDMMINFLANPTGIQDSIATYGSNIHFIGYLGIFPLIFSQLSPPSTDINIPASVPTINSSES